MSHEDESSYSKSTKLPDAAAEIVHVMEEQGVAHPILKMLVKGFRLRAETVLEEF